MERRATVVIGANYGDEGKGLMTDYFSARSARGLVIRFNGGCQAGHTVVTPDGRRHVFSHLGSGLFAGADSFLSRHFAVNPALFLKERTRLGTLLPDRHRLFVDVRAPVTTYYDMLLNQLVEDFRGAQRHGSCGMGFGETIGRHETGQAPLVAGDLVDVEGLRRKLLAIRDVHLPRRCLELGLPGFGQHHDLCTTDVLVDAFIAAAKEFLEHAELVANLAAVAGRYDHLVFEGAQGLLLDQTRGAFPHVTRSNTGLQNAVEVAQEAQLAALEVTYVTRSYLTRHGAGPLAGELSGPPYEKVVDLTNQPNTYQGPLRFAYLDHDLLRWSVHQDLAAAEHRGLSLRASLAVTCLDHVDDRCFFWREGQLRRGPVEQQLQHLAREVLPVKHCSWGASREAVQDWGGG